MTIPSTARKAGPLLGNGVTTSFPFTFKVFAASDIQVTVADANGLETVLVLNTDYSVTLNGNQETSPGGTITYPLSGSPLAIGEKLTVTGAIDFDQPLDLPSGGNFSPLALENQLDRTVMQIQQLAEEVDRTVKINVTTSADVTLPAPEAAQLIGWDQNGTGLTNYDIPDLFSAAVYADWVFDTFTGTGAQTTFVLQRSPGNVANCDVSVDGQTYVPNVDFTISGNVLAFTVAPINGAEILVRYGQAAQQVSSTFSTETQTATGGQTVFNLTSATYAPGSNNLGVYVNGLRYTPGVDFTETDSNTVTMTSGLTNGDEVLFICGRILNDAVGAEQVSYLPAGTGAVATNVQSKLREFVSRADYDSDANYNAARNALTGRADHRIRVEGGATDRLLSAKLGECVSVLDFGADPTGFADSTSAIQAAINYAASVNGLVISPTAATYRCTAGITQSNSASVDFGGSVLTFYGVSGDAWTITSGKEIRHITKPLKNVWIRGHATLSAGNYNVNLRGLVFNAPQQQVENVLVTGCVKAYEFLSDSYVINLEGCAAWYNQLSWNANQDGNSNMGAALSATNCLFAHNDRDVFNKLCESQFFNCAFDQIQQQFVEDNITSAGGVTNSQLLFEACRFEAGGNASASLFKNSGLMRFNDCQFFEPLTYLNFFENSGDIRINGGLIRIESEFYNSTGAGRISVIGLRPWTESGPGWKFSANESGVFNGNIETGTTAGFSVTTGNPADLQASTAITPHSGTYSLRMTGSASPNILQSYPMQVKGDCKRFMLSVYMQNRNAVDVYPRIRFYDAIGNQLSDTSEILSASTTTWVLKRFITNVPNGAAYARFYLDLNSGFGASNWVYMDDFYVNQW